MLNPDVLSVSSILHSHSRQLADALSQRKQEGSSIMLEVILTKQCCLDSLAIEGTEIETFFMRQFCSHSLDRSIVKCVFTVFFYLVSKAKKINRRTA